MSANYFEVIKTCFLLSLISIYCSLSIRFNCLWNFVSLWLWVALDLSFLVFVFMEFCWFVVVGCSGFTFFFLFLLFFSLKISTFSSSSFVVKSVANKNHEIFLIRFSFSLFFLCNFYWIFGFLGFFYLIYNNHKHLINFNILYYEL